MNQLVEILNDEVVTTSRQVAEVFNKDHSKVLRDIRELMKAINEDKPNLDSPEKFIEDTYINGQNKQQPMYIMNRDAFTLLVMGYTTKNALKFKRMYIQAFNQMEAELKKQVELTTPSYQIEDPIKRAERWIEEEKERKLLAENNKKLEQDNKVKAIQLAEYEPKVTYYDKVLQSKGLVNISVIAKDYGMSGRKMNELLHNVGIQYKQGKVWLPYSKHQDKGYTKTTTTKDGYVHMKWTQQGRLFIYDTLKQHGVLPLIER